MLSWEFDCVNLVSFQSLWKSVVVTYSKVSTLNDIIIGLTGAPSLGYSKGLNVVYQDPAAKLSLGGVKFFAT